MLSRECILEVSQLLDKAEALSRGSAAQRQQATVLQQRAAVIRQTGMTTVECRRLYTEATELDSGAKVNDAAYAARFNDYLRTGNETELRQFLVGSQQLVFTAGESGGYAVPFAYDSTLRIAMAQTDPLMSESVCSFAMSDSPTLRPEQVSGFDLSSISAQLVAESSQMGPQSVPTVAGNTLRSDLIFRCTLTSTWETETDIPDFAAKVVEATGVALARRIGRSVVSGRGGSDIDGIVNALGAPTLSNTTSGKLTLSDVNDFFFGINRFYRARSKCGWLMTDSAYKFLRNAVDDAGRPLLSVQFDSETLLGKPVYVSPSLATAYTSIGLQGALIFGDLSALVVRMSRPTLSHTAERPDIDITKGLFGWIARARADAVYFDPSGGANPPVMLAAIS